MGNLGDFLVWGEEKNLKKNQEKKSGDGVPVPGETGLWVALWVPALLCALGAAASGTHKAARQQY